MNEAKAREILGAAVCEDGSLYSVSRYVCWYGAGGVTLDGDFTPDQLEAIAWWMRSMKVMERG